MKNPSAMTGTGQAAHLSCVLNRHQEILEAKFLDTWAAGDCWSRPLKNKQIKFSTMFYPKFFLYNSIEKYNRGKTSNLHPTCTIKITSTHIFSLRFSWNIVFPIKVLVQFSNSLIFLSPPMFLKHLFLKQFSSRVLGFSYNFISSIT